MRSENRPLSAKPFSARCFKHVVINFVSLVHTLLHNCHVIVIVELLSTQDIVLVFVILEGGCDARKAPLEMLVF